MQITYQLMLTFKPQNIDPNKQQPIIDDRILENFVIKVRKEQKWPQWFGNVTRMEITRATELKFKGNSNMGRP
jgi:hypothetical protein